MIFSLGGLDQSDLPSMGFLGNQPPCSTCIYAKGMCFENRSFLMFSWPFSYYDDPMTCKRHSSNLITMWNLVVYSSFSLVWSIWTHLFSFNFSISISWPRLTSFEQVLHPVAFISLPNFPSVFMKKFWTNGRTERIRFSASIKSKVVQPCGCRESVLLVENSSPEPLFDPQGSWSIISAS